jgi:crotonobetainyl-CoA:carnitine CoA-transferase CaiB-like acyl-CoA transferase
MGGIMSLTGEPEGRPMKVGVAAADVMCGMYAAVAILAALRHRDATGVGQHIDLALFDTQLAWLINAATSYFDTGRAPARHGNAHPQIVPYQTFATADGEIALAVGNDDQFARLCAILDRGELAQDPRFTTNAARLRHRDPVIPIRDAGFATRPSALWVETLRESGVPCGPVRDLPQVFEDPQIEARGMRVALPHPSARRGEVELIGNPIKLSTTPVHYRRRPPALGEHTGEVLREVLGMDEDELARLRERGVL